MARNGSDNLITIKINAVARFALLSGSLLIALLLVGFNGTSAIAATKPTANISQSDPSLIQTTPPATQPDPPSNPTSPFGVEPLEIKTAALAKKWFRYEFLGMKRLFSKEERAALVSYQKTPEINRYLRKLGKNKLSDSEEYEQQTKYQDTGRQDYGQQIKYLDRALVKTPLKTSVVVYRGLPKSAIPTAIRQGKVNTFVDKGYVSTSVLQPIALGFAGGTKGAMLRMTLPVGSCVASPTFTYHGNKSSYSREFEVLLPRNTQFTLLKAQAMDTTEMREAVKEHLRLAKEMFPKLYKQNQKHLKKAIPYFEKRLKSLKIYEVAATPSCNLPAAPSLK